MFGIRQVHRAGPTWVVLALLSLQGSTVAEDAINWKTGPALQRQLIQRVGVTWEERPLREALASLSRKFGVGVFLDRRIDPGRPNSMTLRDQPLEQVLSELASRAKAGTAQIGSVLYVGPPLVAASLPNLASARRQDASRFPAEVKSRLLRPQPWQWNELAEPRALLSDLTREVGVSVENASVLPHDLWPAVSLPPLVWTDRMTLLLAGFGLTFEIDNSASSVRLIRIAESTAGERAAVSPSAAKKTKGPLGEKRYSLELPMETPAGEIVKSVANLIDKKLSYDPALLPKLKQTVALKVKDVTLDELLTRALQPLGLTYRITEDALEVMTSNQP